MWDNRERDKGSNVNYRWVSEWIQLWTIIREGIYGLINIEVETDSKSKSILLFLANKSNSLEDKVVIEDNSDI